MNKATLLLPHLEFEFRLGKKQKTFNSDIGNERFKKLQNVLLDHKGWNDVKYTETTDNFYGKIRKTESCDQAITKKKLHNEITKVSSDFDIRLSLSQEIPCEVCNSTVTKCRKKDRISFFHKNWCIDTTRVSEGENTAYEVELEFFEDYVKLHSFEYLKSEGLKQLVHLLACSNI